MTDKELRRLNRKELIELLLEQERELERIQRDSGQKQTSARMPRNSEQEQTSARMPRNSEQEQTSARMLRNSEQEQTSARTPRDSDQLQDTERLQQASAQAQNSEQVRKNSRQLQRRKGSPPTAAQLDAELKREQYRSRYSRVLRSTVSTLIVVAALSVLVATLFLPVLQIYGTSMTPTVTAGDVVVSVKGSEFKQGDLISFYYQNTVLVKRVIATAGDWVDIDENGNVYVNGELLEEPYLQEDAKAYGTVTIDLPYQVGEGRIFVMGDHRSTSIDSRTEEIGDVAEEYIIGKIVFRIWPLKEFGVLD